MFVPIASGEKSVTQRQEEGDTVTELEKIINWLQTFPHWGGTELSVDYVKTVPGCAGLYPQGVEEVSRHSDVLGNVTVENRLRFMLYRVSAGQCDSTDAAIWLLQLQNWIQSQSTAGMAPRLGDDPARERIRAEQGKLRNASQSGTGKYAVTITAEYVKYY